LRWDAARRETNGPRASKAHLYDVASRLDIRGRSRMTKGQLVEAIKKENRARTRRAS